MGSHDYQRLGVSASVGDSDIGRSRLLRQAARRTGILIVSFLASLAVAVAYRFLFDPADERGLAYFLRSALQRAGVAFAVQMGFASGARSRSGSGLRRLPLAGELVVRAVVMAAAVIVVSLTPQFPLYWQPFHLKWLTPL